MRGRVQGVFFRAFVLRRARELDISGYVRNAPDGSVEVYAEGQTEKLGTLIEFLKTGPPAARVDAVSVEWLEPTDKYTGFSISY